MKKVAIIGAGLAGLSAGIKLAQAGVEVVIYEKNSHVGGKMMSVDIEGYHFDFGPNTITMPHVFENVLKLGGEHATKLNFIKLVDHTLNHYADGTQFLQTQDKQKMVEELKKFDPLAASSYHQYLSEVNRLYELANKEFFYRSFSGLKDYLSPKLAMALMKVKPFMTMDKFHRQYFADEHVLQAFNRYATYIGSSPYQCPATFALIGSLEMNQGVYYVKGGNVKIAEAFATVFQSLGGKIHLNVEVRKVRVRNKAVVGIELENGDWDEVETCILAGDVITGYERLIAETDRPHFTNQTLQGYEPSISAFVILAGVRKRLESSVHHQVFFSSNYQQEFKEIFHDRKLPSDPTIYICNSSVTDPDVSKGANLFILVNAPAGPITKEEAEQYKKVIYEKLANFGLDFLPNLEVEEVITSEDLKDKFHAYQGALYGISSHRKKDAFLRPLNKDKRVKGLYFAGGTTHPGGGSPMVVISGQNVANLILQQWKKGS